MKLLRVGPPGAEKPAMLDPDGALRDLSGIVRDFTGEALSAAGLSGSPALDCKSLPKVEGNPRIGPCVPRPVNFVCIGLNYADHAAETGIADPEGADRVPEIARRLLRPERRREDPARLEEDRLGGRARRRHRHARQLRAGATRRWTTSPAIASATT